MSDRGRGRGRSGGRGGGGGRGPTPSGGRGPTPSGGRGPTPSGGPSVSGGRGYGGPTSSGGPSVSGGRGYGGPIPSAGPSPSGGRGYGGPPSGSRGYAGPPSGGRGYAGPPTSGDRGYGSPSTPPVSALGSELEKLSLSSSSTAVALPATATPQPMQQTAPATVQQPPQPPPSSSKAIRIPARPGYGSSGRRCLVRANHFLVKVADTLDIHHYDVTISPEVLSKKVCRDVVQKLVDDFKQTHMDGRTLAYDGRKSVYTAGPLPFSSKEFAIKLADDNGGARRDREFKVSIKFAAKADLSHLKQFLQCKVSDCPHETIQALDVALRAPPSAKYTVVGRSFFATTLGEIGSLGEGLEYWRGYYQSLRPTQMGLSLNIDMSARPFYEPICVVDYVAQYLNLRDPRNLNRSPMSDRDRNKVRRVLKGVRVQIDYRGIRRYKISGLSVQPIKELTFVDDTGGRTSVVEYFRQKYNITFRFPMLPAIQAGNDAKPVYLPMELCTIVSGQRYTKMLSGRQVSEMLKATCQRPSGREGIIKQIVNSNQYHVDLLMKEFGIEVQTELTTVEARVLAPPGIKFGGSRMDPRVGQWNMIDKKMVNGGKVDTWTCVNFSRSDESEFVHRLIEMCCNKGMEFNPQPLVDFRSAHPGNIERTLAEIHAECAHKLKSTELKHLQLLIIILPEASGSYGTIKRICETDLGIVSQCCQPKNVSRPNMQYLENVALKINVKAGGRNSVLEMAVQRRIPFLTDMPTIVFGADVTHPQPGEDSSPSIASVVASMDWPEVSKYRGLVSAQTHRREIIADLYTKHEDPKKGIVHGGMIKELLVAFFKSTKLKPARLIFYRDGVSEGQFNQVLLEEMDAIRQACAALEPGYMPRVTFVVVQKRHHTRLFPANHNDRNLTDKSGNILPGTVIDTKICHPWEFDFYLCSHAGIKGTSRPTHYHVLHDENGFTADAIQNLTNQLCYTYARCTRSVSIVPPAYYAHLAAFRARYYMEGDTTDAGSSSGGGGNTTRDRTAVVRPLPIIKDNVKEVMFYC